MRRIAVGLLLVTAAACSGDAPTEQATSSTTAALLPGYTDAVRATFLDQCAGGGGDFDVCECSFDRLSREMPYERFTEVDRFLNTNPDSELPDDFVEIVEGCTGDEVGA